ncbi:hypothetical protein MMC21_007199 [Puttea exsequens]|nr:hypothetical protein [Puttea exsequens]
MRRASLLSLFALAPLIVKANVDFVTRVEKRQQVVYSIPDYKITGALDPQFLTTSGSVTKFIGPTDAILPSKRTDYLTVTTTTNSAGTQSTASVSVALYTGNANGNSEFSIIISPALQDKLNSALNINAKRQLSGGPSLPELFVIELTVSFTATVLFGIIAIPAAAVATIIWLGYQELQHPPLAIKVPSSFLDDYKNCPTSPQDCNDPTCAGSSANVCSKGIGCPCQSKGGKCPAGTQSDPVLGCSECGGPQSGVNGTCKGLTAYNNLWENCYCYDDTDDIEGYDPFGSLDALIAAQQALRQPGTGVPQSLTSASIASSLATAKTALLVGSTTSYGGLGPSSNTRSTMQKTLPSSTQISPISSAQKSPSSATQKVPPSSASVSQATPTGGFWILALKEAGGSFGAFEDIEVVPDADTASCSNIIAKRAKFIVTAVQLTQSVQVGPEQIATNSQGFKTVQHGTPQCGVTNLTLVYNGNSDGSNNIFKWTDGGGTQGVCQSALTRADDTCVENSVNQYTVKYQLHCQANSNPSWCSSSLTWS